MKKCSKCKIELPESEFWKDKYKKDGLRSACKNCNANDKEYLKQYNIRTKNDRKKYREKNSEKIKKNAREWQKNNPDRVKFLKKRSNLKKYGLTVEDYNNILEKQNYSCAICSSKNFLQVDHDHKCCSENARSCGDCVRGILCRNCNTILGNANDDINILLNAIKYLGGDDEQS